MVEEAAPVAFLVVVVLGVFGVLGALALSVSEAAAAAASPALGEEVAVLASPGSWPIWMILPALYSKP